MTNDLIFERIIINLEIISNISAGQKISDVGFNIAIDDSAFQSISRSLSGDSKFKTIDLLEWFIGLAIMINKLQMRAKPNQNEGEQEAHCKIIDEEIFDDEEKKRMKLFELIKKTKKGLKNLKITYKNFPQIISKINMLIDDIKHH